MSLTENSNIVFHPEEGVQLNFKFEIWSLDRCDFQQCGILTSVDSDEHVQPHFKLRNSM